jgi:cell division protein FtsN
MAKDYGRRMPTRRRSNAPKQLFWLLAMFLGGYLTATVFDFTSLSSWVTTNILAKHKTAKPQAKIVAKEPDLPKPKFEFYTLLAKDRSPTAAPASNPQTAAVQTQQAAQANTLAAKPIAQQPTKAVVVLEGRPLEPATISKDSYLIQLAAFKNRQDAEHMKAGLILKGFNVSIVTAAQWYRVIAGPYNSRNEAIKTQLTLAQNEHIKGMLRKMEG